MGQILKSAMDKLEVKCNAKLRSNHFSVCERFCTSCCILPTTLKSRQFCLAILQTLIILLESTIKLITGIFDLQK